MAQAARLNLRMQKELKLLLTDPPPGVSLPLLTADSDSTNLSSIDAQIDGPEGTVYAKGVFNIKIQIPDRYPFQPPIVTFATPIYHPNIDNGGRICLDILNLPPKGAWQPSLNISTVLTSLGLLLSEPNPDDGLMCEASREYKYNKQAFDQKARSMTEKYAKAGGNVNCSGGGSTSCNIPNTMQAEESETESKPMVNECSLSHKKLQRVSLKLSLESSCLSKGTDADKKEPEMLNQQLSLSYSESLSGAPSTPSKSSLTLQAGSHDVKKIHQDHERRRENAIAGKSLGISRKLSLESSGPSQRRDADKKKPEIVNQQLSLAYSESLSGTPLAASKSLLIPQARSHHQDQERRRSNANESAVSRKPLGISQKLSLESSGPSQRRDADNRNRLPADQQSLLSASKNHRTALSKPLQMPQAGNHHEQPRQDHDWKRADNGTTEIHELCQISQSTSLYSLGPNQRRNDDDKENVEPIHRLSVLHFKSQGIPSDSSKPLPMPQHGNCDEQPNREHNGKIGNGTIDVSLTKVHNVDANLSLEYLGSLKRRGGDKENEVITQLPPSHSQSCGVLPKTMSHPFNSNGQHCQGHDMKIVNNSIKQQEEVLPITETVIVLDSEDSEEENRGSKRSRLSLGRKRLTGNCKARA